MRLRLVISEMLIGLRRNLTLTIAVIVTIAISLLLTSAGLMMRQQINVMKGFWYDKVEVSVFLCTAGDSPPPCNSQPVTDAQIASIGKALSANPEVKHVYYETPQQALQHFKQQFPNDPDLTRNVTAADLGSSYRVKLKDPKKFDVIASEFDGQAGVASVRDQRAILRNLFKLLNSFQAVAIVTAVGASLASIILIGNAIRVAVFSRRREIGVMRLVGASNLYIELPFVLEGALTGLIGGLLSLAGVAAIESYLINGRLKPGLPFNGTAFIGWGSVWGIGLTMLAVGVFMSALIAFITLTLSRATRV